MNTAKIDVTKLLEHPGKDLDVSGRLSLAPATLGDERIDFSTPFSFSVKLTNAGGGIVVRGEIGGSADLKCSRCLDVFKHDIEIDIDEEASIRSDDDEPKEGFQVEDSELDLAPMIYENVIVELPMRPLCRDDCSGLCSRCGKNLNVEPHVHEEVQVDERLAPLKEFFKDQKN